MMLREKALAVCVLFCFGQLGCSSALRNEHVFTKIIPTNLHVRRPPGPGADPQAGPGGYDYKAHPLPNERWDCEVATSLFKDIDLSLFRTCLGMTKENIEVIYRLWRDAEPYFELEENKKTPSCFGTILRKIPVPREIIFQSPEKGSFACYTKRLDLEADQALGTRLPINKYALRLSLPLKQIPQNDKEMERLLTAWILTPFFEESPRQIRAKVLPDRICRQCLGEREVIRDLEEVPLLWP